MKPMSKWAIKAPKYRFAVCQECDTLHFVRDYEYPSRRSGSGHVLNVYYVCEACGG